MLSNMASPALYMQAAFRTQNPCLFTAGNGDTYRKRNAYIFDFDPARTLTIFEQFANDLIPETSGDRGDFDTREQHVRELLNFFPVYGEDEDGAMIELDAEKVLTIPRRIHAKEVVERGFMSNFLFANISGIFAAPKEIIDIISNMQPLEEPKALPRVDIDETTADELSLNEEGDVEIPAEQVIKAADDLFGAKVYADIDSRLTAAVEEMKREAEAKPNPKMEELKSLRERFSKPIADSLINSTVEQYGSGLKKSTLNQLERKIQETTDTVVDRAYGDYTIQSNLLQRDRDDEVQKAQESGAEMSELSRIQKEYEARRSKNYQELVERIKKNLHSEETVKKAAETITETVEKEVLNNQKMRSKPMCATTSGAFPARFRPFSWLTATKIRRWPISTAWCRRTYSGK